MGIGQDQSPQHFDMGRLKYRNGDLLLAELPDSIHVPPKIHAKYKMIPAFVSGNP